MPAILGFVPNEAYLILATGQDFVCTIRCPDEQWAVGTTATLDINGTTWPATVDESEATAVFRVESDETDPIIDGTPFAIYLSFPDTPDPMDYKWFRGIVKRVD